MENNAAPLAIPRPVGPRRAAAAASVHSGPYGRRT